MIGLLISIHLIQIISCLETCHRGLSFINSISYQTDNQYQLSQTPINLLVHQTRLGWNDFLFCSVVSDVSGIQCLFTSPPEKPCNTLMLTHPCVSWDTDSQVSSLCGFLGSPLHMHIFQSSRNTQEVYSSFSRAFFLPGCSLLNLLLMYHKPRVAALALQAVVASFHLILREFITLSQVLFLHPSSSYEDDLNCIPLTLKLLVYNFPTDCNLH